MSEPVVAVVLPTIAGRERLLDATRASYRAAAGVEVVLVEVKGLPTIGQAWERGRAVLDEQGVEYDWLHLSADDVLPTRDALRLAIEFSVDRTAYASPRILNRDGSLHSCGTLGAGMLLPEVPTGSPAGSSPFPLLHREHVERIPPIPPIHYYADDFLGFWARHACGLDALVCREFELLHMEGTTGRERVAARSMSDRALALSSIGDALRPPLVTSGEGQ